MSHSFSNDRPALSIQWTPQGKQMKAVLHVFAGDRLIETETVDLAKPEKRQKFAEKIAESTGEDLKDLETELLAISEQRAKATDAPVEAIPEDDLATATR